MTRWIMGAASTTTSWVVSVLREVDAAVVWAQRVDGDVIVRQARACGLLTDADLRSCLRPLQSGEVEADAPTAREGDVWVGCRPREATVGAEIIGRRAGVDASRFLDGSTIGQVYRRAHDPEARFVFDPEAGVWRLVGEAWTRDLSPELARAAAADHALWYAYRGQCPGVDAEALLVDRVRALAARLDTSPATIEQRLTRVLALLEQAPIITTRGGLVVDWLDGAPDAQVIVREVAAWAQRPALIPARGGVHLVGADPALLAVWPGWCEASGLVVAGVDTARGEAWARRAASHGMGADGEAGRGRGGDLRRADQAHRSA